MEKYINMEDSLDDKLSVSSTKSFQTSYEECIESLKEQVKNHKKALQMAQTLLEHYKKENQQLLRQIQRLNQERKHAQQKYEILQKLFLKFDRQKEKQKKKETRRSQEKHFLQLKEMNFRHENELEALKQKVILLESSLKKYSQKQKEWKQFQIILDGEIYKDYVHIQKKHKQNCLQEAQKIKFKDLKQNPYQTKGNCETLKKIDNFFEKRGESERNNAKIMDTPYNVEDNRNRINLGKKGQSLTIKDKRDLNASNFMVVSAQDNYHSPKQELFRTAQRNKKATMVYDNFLTEYKVSK